MSWTLSRGDGRHAVLQLVKTIHNKWLQQSSNRENDLFAATGDDKIQAAMQTTNYMAYLKDNFSRIGPSRQELKLRVAKHSVDPKKDC
jgi:hypothetical protein